MAEVMNLLKLTMFTLGGAAYVGLELLWRGRSHVSMFVAGGICFLILGAMSQRNWKMLKRGGLGAGAITAVELTTGLLVNRDFSVWDYRGFPGNFLGQICLPYTLLWVPLSLVAMAAYPKVERVLQSALVGWLPRKPPEGA